MTCIVQSQIDEHAHNESEPLMECFDCGEYTVETDVDCDGDGYYTTYHCMNSDCESNQ